MTDYRHLGDREACRGCDAAERELDALGFQLSAARERLALALRVVEAARAPVLRGHLDLQDALAKFDTVPGDDLHDTEAPCEVALAAEERLRWEAIRRSLTQTCKIAIRGRDEVYDTLRSLGWESYAEKETASEFVRRLLSDAKAKGKTP